MPMKAVKIAIEDQSRDAVGPPASSPAATESTRPIASVAKKNGAGKIVIEMNSKVNILLVDDRQDKLLALEAVLGPLGQNLVQAHSGKEALRLLLKQEFAVILMDVSMPGMDGFETASLIRKRPASEHTPIIFVTAIGNTPTQMYQGYSLGAVDYILTPIVPEVLRAKVNVFVDLWRKAEQIRQQSERIRQVEEEEHHRRLAEATDKLEAETKRNRFFTLALDMLGIADFQGHLLQVNPAWERVLGYTEDELRTMSGLELAHPEERETLRESIEALKRGAAVTYSEGRYRHKDGSYRCLGWTAAPFPAEQLIYIFARDITARKQAEEQIRHLNVELEKRITALTDVNRELETFNYSISHDLRAPLRSMNGFAQALTESEGNRLTAHGLDYLRRIGHSAKRMDALLQDLLEYSRVARTDMPPREVSLDAVVNEIVHMREIEIQQKQAHLEIKAPLGNVMAHLPTIQQIMANLIDNGLKFVGDGKLPHLRIWTETLPDSDPASLLTGRSLRIWIEDNGIGIEPEYHEKIFGLFERLHPAHTFPGTGIGLAIVRKGVERMGGRVGLASEPGRGSRFWVELPVSPGEAR